MQVIRIKMTLSNAYLVLASRPFLVDTGAPGGEKAILPVLAQHGIKPTDLALILHTHGHSDHVGSSATLGQVSGAPLVISAIDAPMMASGKNGPLPASRPTAGLIRTFVDKPFPPAKADITLDGEAALAQFGLPDVRVIATPGHTPGSLSVILDDQQAIVGDVLMGGSMGGTFFPSLARYHYFITDRMALHASLKRLLALNLRTWYVGHGGPLDTGRIQNTFRARLDA